MTIATPDGLFHQTLKDVLHAERRILQTLRTGDRTAAMRNRPAAPSQRRQGTDRPETRPAEVSDTLGALVLHYRHIAVQALLEAAEEVIAGADDPESLDASLASIAQSIALFEIAPYSMLVAWAKQLGTSETDDFLKSMLDREFANPTAPWPKRQRSA